MKVGIKYLTQASLQPLTKHELPCFLQLGVRAPFPSCEMCWDKDPVARGQKVSHPSYSQPQRSSLPQGFAPCKGETSLYGSRSALMGPPAIPFSKNHQMPKDLQNRETVDGLETYQEMCMLEISE